MSTVLTIAEPTVKLVEASLPTYLPSPVWTPVRGVDNVTRVPGLQKAAGRHISCRLSSQPHEPRCRGEVVTLTRFSTSARIALVITWESNCTITGMPTPTVPPLGITVYVAVTAGLSVRKVEAVLDAVPSGPVLFAVTV